MRKINNLIAVIVALLCMVVMPVAAQIPGTDFGGFQKQEDTAKYSKKYSDINYAADTATYHTLDIYLPEKGEGPFPTIVHIYGSAWFSNNSKNMADINTICAALLDAGYAVATPNRRSSHDAKYPAQINDIKAAVRFLRANADTYNLDSRFIGASGFSSGAHLASLMGVSNGERDVTIGETTLNLEGNVGNCTEQNSDVYAVCEWSGPIDLLNMDCAGEPQWKPSPEEIVMGMPLEGNEDSYRLLSPVYLMDSNDVPFLVFHGNDDKVVPVCQGRIMDQALEKAGIAHEYIEVEGGGHGFNMYTPENLRKMTEFFDSQRKVRLQPKQ